MDLLLEKGKHESTYYTARVELCCQYIERQVPYAPPLVHWLIPISSLLRHNRDDPGQTVTKGDMPLSPLTYELAPPLHKLIATNVNSEDSYVMETQTSNTESVWNV